MVNLATTIHLVIVIVAQLEVGGLDLLGSFEASLFRHVLTDLVPLQGGLRLVV